MATSDVLAGRRWVIERIGELELLPSPEVTIEFGHDGRVSGSTGINSYNASYDVLGDMLEFGPLATTRRAGAPAEAEQEQLVVGSIAGRCPFRFEGYRFVFDGRLGTVWCWPLDLDPAIEAPPQVEPAEPQQPAEPRPDPRPDPRPTPRDA